MALIWWSVKCWQVIAPDGHQLAQVPQPLHSDALMLRDVAAVGAIATSAGAWNWQMSTQSPQARQRSSSTIGHRRVEA